ncbi:putative uncharacterized protein C3orf56 homolog [Dipodomys spectabilis]|uniref:putative uncharacterized protein C3orf56 homolog n=1 Tax=Dipodomys spectabilis TaxID=105255 RepID=UPI001C53627A|nr:putative uncharacterized protein C3orf56 homolog [Dipodomys spectabilis]
MFSSLSTFSREEQVPWNSAVPGWQAFREAYWYSAASGPCVPLPSAGVCTCWYVNDSILWPPTEPSCEVHACLVTWPWAPTKMSSRDVDSFGAYMGKSLTLEAYNPFPEPWAPDLSASGTRTYRLFPEPSTPNPFALPALPEVISSGWPQGGCQTPASSALGPAVQGLPPGPPLCPVPVTESASSPELHPLPPSPLQDPQLQFPRCNFPRRPPSKAHRRLLFDN